MPFEVTKKYIRTRQFSPKKCRKGTFRTKQVSPRTKLILCKKKGSKKQSAQSILERRDWRVSKDSWN
jgi:hypothetical protein